MDCTKARRKIEMAGEDAPGVLEHLDVCPSCAALARELTEPGRLLRRAGVPDEVDRLRQGLAAAVRARASSGPTPRPAWRDAQWGRPALAAAALVFAAVAGLVAVLHSGPALEAPLVMASAEDQTGFRIVRDGNDVAILFDSNGNRIHRIAKSTRPDFSTSKVTEFQGRRWTDPSPAPIVGGVVFYRVD